MDSKRIELIEKHLAAEASENVRLASVDFVALVTESKTDDAGLVKAAKAHADAVGFVAINRKLAKELLAACRVAARPPATPKTAEADKK